jgi:cytochrome bd ubiquinol oxidase subunit II
VTYHLTVEQAAAPATSLSFLFYGIGLVVLPVILKYTVTVSWIFRGKAWIDLSYDQVPSRR